ncbi:alkylated DNA repair protein (DNA oxidative demethylase) [Pelagimonas varians]|uniref:Alpha-ketoglutarate-dependent dioxygenase AlkB n=2 Tax=Pelagimonas varians TaxID=696760 RepID=A0A238KKZ4_9RHOB|nr:alkylated DNA repair protein (DNA oxidative demethylase) [Pelagimonas varians]SMX43461.1 Alpha-ketoglutarate-dependent dioxygenase AlkB [Pelagimonas varians]
MSLQALAWQQMRRIAWRTLGNAKERGMESLNTPSFRQKGFVIYPGLLDRTAQESLVVALREVLKVAPLVQPVTASGKPMSVRMSAAGDYGWISDRRGYRYEKQHPNGANWPDIPPAVLEIWHGFGGMPNSEKRDPECCLINWYGADARMGMHQDRDETNFDYPVVSISLGDEALFRMGNVERGGKTESLWLKSGDVVVMGGAARLAYHGVDRLRFRSSTLLPQGGRINLTLRMVT